eukprot:scaffold47_cov334-Pavlova_lutheri.AAC.57
MRACRGQITCWNHQPDAWRASDQGPCRLGSNIPSRHGGCGRCTEGRTTSQRAGRGIALDDPRANCDNDPQPAGSCSPSR